MARARLKGKPKETDFEPIGKIIVSAWMKALPDQAGPSPTPLDPVELSLALTNVLDVPCQAVLDTGDLLHIAIPPIPAGVTTKSELITYLHDKHEFSNEPPPEDPNDPQFLFKDNPFNPKNKKKHGQNPGDNKRSFMADLGDAILFGCGR